MVEGARLEIVYTPKGYPGFESLSIRHLYKTLPSAGFCRICGGYKILQKKPGQSHFLKTKKAANKINKKPTISFHFSPSLR